MPQNRCECYEMRHFLFSAPSGRVLVKTGAEEKRKAKMDKSFYWNCVLMSAAVLMRSIASATPTVSGLKVTSIAPWGLAIDYTVSGATDAEQPATPGVKVVHNGQTYKTKTILGEASFTNGAHRIYWNAAKDGITATLENATVQLIYKPVRTAANSLYCVIDLSGGANATSYPVTFLNEEPDGGFNTEEYKTIKLVLKRVNPGTFIIGADQTAETNRVTLTKPFYMGIFEVTERQRQLIVGAETPVGSMYPASGSNYDDIRGDSSWPESNRVSDNSFMGKLRVRTGLDFDLPTEAQWEYACRAGTRSLYWFGEAEDGEYMWCNANSDNKAHIVGTRKPNPWGFYDMYGNLREWCLDVYDQYQLPSGIDPVGPSSSKMGAVNVNIYRVVRGGDYRGSPTSVCRSYQLSSSTTGFLTYYGFRLALTLP